MKKITDFSGIESYFCLRHKREHHKYRKGKLTKTFKMCKDFAYSLSNTEKFRKSFSRNWNKHSNSKVYKEHLINDN